MNLRLTLVFCLVALLGACVTAPVDKPEELSQMQQVSDQIVELEKSLSKSFSQQCEQKIDTLNDTVDALRKAQKPTKVVEKCANKLSSKDLEGKLLMGAVERVKLSKEDVSLEARIDTGADTSSLGVFKLKRFERDGDKWVRFSLSSKKDAKRYEYPIFDMVKIKQSGTVTEDRIEIKLDIELGEHKYKNQLFNLANRSYLDYQLLIGRSFLRDIAVVDVSRKNLVRAKK